MKILNSDKIEILNEQDIAIIRRKVRFLATRYKFSMLEVTKLVTSTSEIARNTLIHAGGGEAKIQVIKNNNKLGIKLIFLDKGPGIKFEKNSNQAIRNNSNGLGLGLNGSRNLTDEFTIEPREGGGTIVIFLLWKK